jgi:hypothetical protein
MAAVATDSIDGGSAPLLQDAAKKTSLCAASGLLRGDDARSHQLFDAGSAAAILRIRFAAHGACRTGALSLALPRTRQPEHGALRQVPQAAPDNGSCQHQARRSFFYFSWRGIVNAGIPNFEAV